MVLGCRLIDQRKRKGRFDLGKWSFPINLLAFFYTLFAVFAFLLPTSWPITCNLPSLIILFQLFFYRGYCKL